MPQLLILSIFGPFHISITLFIRMCNGSMLDLIRKQCSLNQKLSSATKITHTGDSESCNKEIPKKISKKGKEKNHMLCLMCLIQGVTCNMSDSCVTCHQPQQPQPHTLPPAQCWFAKKKSATYRLNRPRGRFREKKHYKK